MPQSQPATPRLSPRVRLSLGLLLPLAASCRHGAVFDDLDQARNVASDLRVQLGKVNAACNQAVMADTDQASAGFARDAETASKSFERELAELDAMLRQLALATALERAADVRRQWVRYRELDRIILALAVENTNLKAQALAFGPAREAANAFRDSVVAAATGARKEARCRADTLAGEAELSVRQIQVLLTPHIAEAQDEAMAELERQMASLNQRATDTLAELAKLCGAPLSAALAALAHFQELSRTIVQLSRRNTNVRSLRLSLQDKPALAAACDESLLALQALLASTDFGAKR
jgi:hypothetical protein